MKKLLNKRGAMTDGMVALGVGVVALAIVIGTGIVVTTEFGNSVGGDANTSLQFIAGELGQSGLAGWIPAIIALTVGLLFLGAFVARRGRAF